MARRKLAHHHPDDRNVAPLRPRRELFEALFAYAVHLSARRRKRAELRPAPINAVAERGQIWFKARRGQLLVRYHAHVKYLGLVHPMSPRTLTRHVARLRRLRLVAVGNYSRFDHQRDRWLQEPNVYTITRDGVLWIKRHARALRIPRFL